MASDASQSWFASELANLKGDAVELPMSPQHLEPASAISVTAPLLPVAPVSEVDIYLPLSKDMSLYVS
jgi:hypothetical protein